MGFVEKTVCARKAERIGVFPHHWEHFGLLSTFSDAGKPVYGLRIRVRVIKLWNMKWLTGLIRTAGVWNETGPVW